MTLWSTLPIWWSRTSVISETFCSSCCTRSCSCLLLVCSSSSNAAWLQANWLLIICVSQLMGLIPKMNLCRNFPDGLLQDCGNTSLIACETMFVLNLAGANCFSSSSENLTFFAQYPSSLIPFPHFLSHTRQAACLSVEAWETVSLQQSRNCKLYRR